MAVGGLDDEAPGRSQGATEREPLKGEVEVDECWIGGVGKAGPGTGREDARRVAVEVRGQGSGRLRLAPLADAALHEPATYDQITQQVQAAA